MRIGSADDSPPPPSRAAARRPVRLAPLTRRGFAGSLVVACFGRSEARATSTDGPIEQGMASYYARRWAGRSTASGHAFDPAELTGAHAWLPFGTDIRVVCPASGREVIVAITDRLGTDRRVIDLSHEAARRLGMLSAGITHVTLAYA